MPNTPPIDVVFPMGGLNRRGGYQQKGVYTTEDALNVRPDGTLEGRQRGGSRPGLGKVFPGRIGGGGPVRLLESVNVAGVSGGTVGGVYFDGFQGEELGEGWFNPFWTPDLPAVNNGVAYTSLEEFGDGFRGAIRPMVDDIDLSLAHQFTLAIEPHEQAFAGIFQLVAGYDTATPQSNWDNLVFVEMKLLTHLGRALNWNAKLWIDGGIFLADGSESGSAQPGLLTLAFEPGLPGSVWTVRVTWRGIEIFQRSMVERANNQGFGFNLAPVELEGGHANVGHIQLTYLKEVTDSTDTRQILVASADGVLEREVTPGIMETLNDENGNVWPVNVASDHLTQAIDFQQKLYIADTSRIFAEGRGFVEDVGEGEALETRLTTTGIDWTDSEHDDLPLNSNAVAVLSQVLSPLKEGVYPILSLIASNTLLLGRSAGGTGDCTYRIERGPKVFDPAADELIPWAVTDPSDVRQIPVGCPLIVRAFGRLGLAGAAHAPHVWYMSAVGDPLNWSTLLSENTKDPLFGANMEAGDLAGPMTAWIPHSDDYLIFAEADAMWILRGDPTLGAIFDSVSHTIGVVDRAAWCHGPAGQLIFLSRDGLYGLSSGANDPPVSLSREKLPRELVQLDKTRYMITLIYDVEARGVHINLTTRQSGAVQLHFWYDWETASYWPLQLPSDQEPTVIAQYRSLDVSNRGVILGCRDGYVRRYFDNLQFDDGQPMPSHVWLGPIRLGGSNYVDGMLMELIGELADESDSVKWRAYVGNTPEAAKKSEPAANGDFVAGLNYKERPRLRGNGFFLKVFSDDSRRWALERITVVRAPAGRQRLL